MEKTQVKVEFYIWGDEINPFEISKILKIEPSRIGLKGQDLDGFNTKQIDNFWEINTGYKNSYDINKQIKPILKKITNKKKLIQSILKDHNAQGKFEIVINVEQGRIPAMYLKKDFIEFLAFTGIEVDFDFYYFSAATD